jgi:hypothetical protein
MPVNIKYPTPWRKRAKAAAYMLVPVFFAMKILAW